MAGRAARAGRDARDARAGRDARDARWAAMMAAAQEGDARAYAALLGECLPLLRATCRARLGHGAEVEDAVQDALLTIHRVRHTYDPARPLAPWLMGALHDATGGYGLAFASGIAASALSALAIWRAAPRKVRVVAGQAPR
jgi:hypothetical protein